MKIQDLQKYKTLDITQLSGSPWNTAEKVLGLDSGDTVVMANRMDDEAKQYTDEAIASALTSYYTKDEVDEIVADIDVTEQLANYYTKSEVDTANAAQDERIENNENDIADLQSGMVSKSEFETAMADETARTESTYAKPSDIPDLTPYATKGWVESKSYVNGAFVDAKVNEAITNETARTESVYAKKTDIPDMGEYATENYVDAAIQVETARTESTYLKEHQSLENYYTKSQVDGLIEDIDVSDQLANYALISSVTADINTAIANETARTENTYAKPSDIPSLDGYAKTTAVTQDIQLAIASETARTENVYAKKSEVPSLDGYATEQYVDNAIAAIPPVDLSAYAKTTAVTQDIQTAIAAETARTESTYLKEHQSLADYSTTSEVEGMISNATDNLASKQWVESQGYLTEHQDISGKLDVSTFNTYTGATETVLDGKADISDIPDVSDFVTSGEVATQIGTAMASETARTESTYLKEHQDISGKLDKTDFNTYTGATETALNGKVDLATYTAYTGSTATAIAAKQDTLVNGTNIKTINNQSLLGSGNIDIQGGGGGGGETVVELTKAQYEALDPPAADTTYIITDADVVDLNDYAKASGLTELSATTTTALAGKADKANTTARNGYYFPAWNAQGIITGIYTQVYAKNDSINGNSYSVLATNNNTRPTIYAPTSAGTAGQPLLSNGSGAPVWGQFSFQFISQSAYDALTTKSSTTIYFIVDPS